MDKDKMSKRSLMVAYDHCNGEAKTKQKYEKWAQDDRLKYFEILKENNMCNGDVLSEISRSDLKEIGVSKLGDRILLMKMFATLQFN